MISNYTTVTVSANANENIIPLINEILRSQGIGMGPSLHLDFVGFETEAGTTFKINGRALKVPLSGKFFSPYCSQNEHMIIESLTFDNSINNLNFWIIY